MNSRSGRAAREEREKMLKLKHKFDNRITLARFGKESLDIKDFGNAVKKFTDYFTTMAEAKRVSDMYALRVHHFDSKKDLTEMMMISHLYFELARMYDVAPQFHDEAKKCLDQFVHFSANQPYQVVNSELIRKRLKKSQFKNPDAFRHAYAQIFVQSKKCYVVTFCLGETHPVTQRFRELKDVLLDHSWGRTLIRWYYLSSHQAVEQWSQHAGALFVGKWIMRPLLVLFSKVLLPLILGR